MINFVLPSIITFIVSYGLVKKIDVFDTFVCGVNKGVDICVKIFPTILGLVTAVFMFKASGAIDIISNVLYPITSFLGIPKECTALVLLKPISAGGGLAIGSEILKTYGADSYVARVAAVMLASSETSFYTMSLYFGSLGINKIRYTMIAALTADFVAFIVASHVVKFLY